MPEITMNKSTLGQTVQISTVRRQLNIHGIPVNTFERIRAPCQTPHNLESCQLELYAG
jgi:hypothetical protein